MPRTSSRTGSFSVSTVTVEPTSRSRSPTRPTSSTGTGVPTPVAADGCGRRGVVGGQAAAASPDRPPPGRRVSPRRPTAPKPRRVDDQQVDALLARGDRGAGAPHRRLALGQRRVAGRRDVGELQRGSRPRAPRPAGPRRVELPRRRHPVHRHRTDRHGGAVLDGERAATSARPARRRASPGRWRRSSWPPRDRGRAPAAGAAPATPTTVRRTRWPGCRAGAPQHGEDEPRADRRDGGDHQRRHQQVERAQGVDAGGRRAGQQADGGRRRHDDEHEHPRQAHLRAALEPAGLDPVRHRRHGRRRPRRRRRRAPALHSPADRSTERVGSLEPTVTATTARAATQPTTPATESDRDELGGVEQPGRDGPPPDARGRAAPRAGGGPSSTRPRPRPGPGRGRCPPGWSRPRRAGPPTTGRRRGRRGPPRRSTIDGRRATGSSTSSERAVSSRRRRLTASAVRWNWPSRGVGSISRDWADQSSSSPVSLRQGGGRGEVGDGEVRPQGRLLGVGGEGLVAEVGPQPFTRGRLGGAAVGLHRVGAEHPGGGRLGLGQPGQLHLHLVAGCDPGRRSATGSGSQTPWAALRRARGDDERAAGSSTPNSRTGARPRVTGHHRAHRVVEHLGVQLGGDGLGGDPRRSDAPGSPRGSAPCRSTAGSRGRCHR